MIFFIAQAWENPFSWIFLVVVFTTRAGDLLWMYGERLSALLQHGWILFFALFSHGTG